MASCYSFYTNTLKRSSVHWQTSVFVNTKIAREVAEHLKVPKLLTVEE